MMVKHVAVAAALLQVGCHSFDRKDDAPETVPDVVLPELEDWPTEGEEIRVLVAYPSDTWDTLEADIYWDNVLDIVNRVETANVIFQDSSINHTVVLADTARLDQVTESDIAAAYPCNEPGETFGPQCAARWLSAQLEDDTSELAIAREAEEADVVALMLVYNPGYTAGGTATLYAPWLGRSEHGAGFTLLASSDIMAFTHELGHVLGCSHDRFEMGVGPTGGINYGFTDHANEKYTLMAYPDECEAAGGTRCRWVPYFSGPTVDPNGTILGDAATEFNACIAQYYGYQVAKYHEVLHEGETPWPHEGDAISYCPYLTP
jgi:hypothetical protein